MRRRTDECHGETYEIQLPHYVTHGIDLWLNNLLPPMEAGETSGLKASLKGVPHLRVLVELLTKGFNCKNRWIFGKARTLERDPGDTDALYALLVKEIIPLCPRVEEDVIPHARIRVMKGVMKNTATLFCSRRTVKGYVREFYQAALEVAQ